MRLRTVIVIICAALLGGLWSGISAAQRPSGYDIAKAVDERPVPKDFKAYITMTLVNKHGKTRVDKMYTISKDDNRKQIIWFLAPPDDKGVAFLKIEHPGAEDEMRLYLPAFKKVRRISARKKGESFMGSDLSYEDLTSRELDDYTYRLLSDTVVNEQECYRLESTPKPGVTRTYGRFVTCVTKDKYLPILDFAYDRHSRLLKIRKMTFKPVKDYDMPISIDVENVRKKHSTHLKFDRVEVDTGVSDHIFREQSLKRIPKL